MDVLFRGAPAADGGGGPVGVDCALPPDAADVADAAAGSPDSSECHAATRLFCSAISLRRSLCRCAVHMHTHTHTHVHMYTHTHTHTRMKEQKWPC